MRRIDEAIEDLFKKGKIRLNDYEEDLEKKTNEKKKC